MPYADPGKARLAALDRGRRYRAKKRAEKYGPAAGDQRGRHGNHARGPKNGRWNDGRIVNDDGYVKVRVGRDHPLADPNGYAYEHLLVWISAGKPAPKKDELLHHKDDSKTNNRINNLELKSYSDHGRHHIATRKRDAFGRLLPGHFADPSEWPEELRVREMPGGRPADGRARDAAD